MIQGVDNIGICTTDVARSVAFYQRLGFSEVYRNERGVLMAAGAAHLFIFATQQSNPPPVGRDLGLFGNPPGIDHISFAVADVDAMYATLRATTVPHPGRGSSKKAAPLFETVHKHQAGQRRRPLESIPGRCAARD